MAVDVAVAGNYAYIADYERGLHVIDIANPTMPTEVALFDMPGEARGVAVSGSNVHVAARSGGLRIIDITDPSEPNEIGFSNMPFEAWKVAVVGNYSYVAAIDEGLMILLFTKDNTQGPYRIYLPGVLVTNEVSNHSPYQQRLLD